MNRLSRIVLATFLVLFSAPALGQETVEPSGAQQDYNDKGVIAMQKGRFGEAVASFRSSLSLGELNVTHLNLGRAYFRMGQCLDARESYDAARSAPAVSAPTPSEIDELLTRFDKEWVEECSGRVELECEGNPKVAIGETIPRSCDKVEAWPVVPGPVTVKYRYGTESFEEKVTVEAGQTVAVSLGMDDDDDEVAGGGAGNTSGNTSGNVEASPSSSGSTLGTIGWVAGGVGLALIGTALAYDLAVTGPAFDDLDALSDTPQGRAEAESLREDISGYQTTTLVLGGVGAAALIGGVVLILLDDDEPAPVSAWLNEHRGGFAVGGTW